MMKRKKAIKSGMKMLSFGIRYATAISSDGKKREKHTTRYDDFELVLDYPDRIVTFKGVIVETVEELKQ
jgi:hypothetical protein